MSKDYYKILGAKKDATKEEIKSLYRKASLKYHPDRQHNKSESEKKAAEEKFKEVAEAADVLLDDKKRAQYDQFGTVDGNYSAGGGFDAFSAFKRHFGGMSGFGDLFGAMGGMRGHRVVRGSDIHTVVDITFKESITGCDKSVSYQKESVCSKCGGSGIEDGFEDDICPLCGGTGMVTQQRGNMIMSSTCHHCHGAGRFNNHPCHECNGHGVVGKHETKTIEIPMGIDNNQTFVLNGEGNASPDGSGPNGDFAVSVRVGNSNLFKRVDEHIYTTAYVTPDVAVNGGKVDVLCPDGTVKTITVKDGQNFDKRVCVNGCGVKFDRRIGRPSGNLYVKLEIAMPKMDSDQLKMFDKLFSSFSRENYSKCANYDNDVRRYK